MELSLDRFKEAHAGDYDRALAEIKAGRKESHWMWYIFPQLQGLGHSPMAVYYGIQSKAEAAAYWEDPVLRSHMAEICRELLKHHAPIEQILGYTDSLKLRSSMTLFWLATGEPLFKEVLDQFCRGSMDPFTKEKCGFGR